MNFGKDYAQSAISPKGLIVFAFLPLMLTICLPDSLYLKYVGEHFIVADGSLILFYISCLMCIYTGSRLISERSYEFEIGDNILNVDRLFIFLTISTLIVSGMNFLSIVFIAKNSTQLLSLIFAGQGDLAKRGLDTAGTFANSQVIAIAFNSYAIYRYTEIKGVLNVKRRNVLLLLVCTSIAVTILSSIVKVARYELFPIFIQIVFIRIMIRSRVKQTSFSVFMIRYIIPSLVFVPSLFIMFSVFRGASGEYDILESLLGYGVAPFNHLAAYLHGQLYMSYEGTGIHGAPFLISIPFLSNFLELPNALGMPTVEQSFLEEFYNTTRSGLNGRYIWITLFGYLYSDFGWMTFPSLVAFGGFLKRSWIGFLQGNAFCIVLYIHFAQSMILAGSTNMLTRGAINYTILLSILVFYLERWFVGRKAKAKPQLKQGTMAV